MKIPNTVNSIVSEIQVMFFFQYSFYYLTGGCNRINMSFNEKKGGIKCALLAMARLFKKIQEQVVSCGCPANTEQRLRGTALQDGTALMHVGG